MPEAIPIPSSDKLWVPARAIENHSMNYGLEVLNTETLYDGFLKLNRYRLRHALFSGGMSPELVRERIERLRASSVLLYDPWEDQVVLVEQFRIGALGQRKQPWLLETVGGYIPEGETPEAVARREALEETGCELTALEPICTFMVSPGTSVDQIHLFCGRVDATKAGGIHGLEEEGEDIQVVVMDADAAIGELYSGRADSTSIIIALQWLARHREGLRKRWRE